MNNLYKGPIIRLHGLDPLSRSSNCPFGFEQYKSREDGKVYLFCLKKCNLSDGTTRKCDFCVRKDRASKNPQILQHDHKINTLHSFVSNSVQKVKIPALKDIQEQLATFIAEANISINAVLQQSFSDLMIMLLRAGENLSESEITTIAHSCRQFKNIRQAILDKSANKFEVTLDIYKDLKYNALCVDAGTQNTVHYLYIALCNALYHIPPLLVHLEQDFHGNRSTYKEVITDVIEDLLSKGIEIMTICSDNLPVQVDVLNPRSIHSIQRSSNTNSIKAIRWLPCSCHTMALAFMDAKKDPALSTYFENAIALNRILNRQFLKDFLIKKPPTICDTRWNSLFLACYYVAKNYENIISAMHNLHDKYKNNDFKEACKGFKSSLILVLILWPYAIATTLLESDSMSGGFIYPLTISSMKLSIKNCQHDDILKKSSVKLAEKIEKRLVSTESGTFCSFLFSLTLQGRDYFRSHMYFSYDGSPKSSHTYTKQKVEIKGLYSEEYESFKELYSQVINNYDDLNKLQSNGCDPPIEEQNENNAILNGNDRLTIINEVERRRRLVKAYSGINYVDPDSSESEQDNSDIVDVEEENDESENLFSNLPNPSDTSQYGYIAYQALNTEEGIIQSGERILREICKEKCLSREYTNDLIKAYETWLICDENYLVGLCHDSTLRMWQCLESHQEFQELSKVARGLLAVPASEACCERGFWLLKRNVRDVRNRSQKDLLKGRMILQSLKL